MVDSTQSVSTWTSISSRTQDQHNQVLLILCSLLSLPPHHFNPACFLCFGRNTFPAQRHFGIFCVLPGLWSFVFSVCVLPCTCEREGGPGPSLKTLCDLLSPAPCLSLPRVEICRDRHDQWSCKTCASCVYFPRKQSNFLSNFCRTTRFTLTKCDFALKLSRFYLLS